MSGYLHQPKIIFILFLSLIPYGLYSQVVATFSSSVSTGCAPLAVIFTPDYSGGTSYLWDFGNGNASNTEVAYATFNTPGTYTVHLTVSDGVSSASSTMSIIVFSNPVPSFTFTGQDNNGCAPSTATLQDLSMPANAPIVQWFWDFGDGYTTLQSSSSSVSHNYVFSGDFSISLEVTDANGCSDNLLLNNLIHVSSLPLVSFYANVTQFCEIPAEVSFINASTGYGTLSSFWDFGDTQTSLFTNPVHSFSNYGNYNIGLTITDANGCSNSATLINYVKIDSVTALFSIPDTVCSQDTFVLNNLTTGANTYFWDWQVGISADLSPEISITQGGFFIVSLEASLNGICNDIYSEGVFVETVMALYSPDPWYVCHHPTTVNFLNYSLTNNSSGLSDFVWDFELYYPYESLTPSFQQSPSLLYNADSIFLSETNNWTYHNTLTVTSPFGCVDTFEDSVVVWLPVPELYLDQPSSCAPSLVTLADSSSYDSPYDSIISWVWNFYNSSPPYFGQFPPPQLYADTGVFAPTLTMTTQFGCVDTVWDGISVGWPQSPSFIMLTPDTICASDYVEFLSTSQDTAIIQTYEWVYSDFNEHISPGQYTYTHPYDTGWVNVTHSISHNGCDSSITVNNVFYSLGPVGWASVTHDCINPLLYTFKPDSNYVAGFVEADHFYWDFSDGSPLDSVNQYIQHLYTTSPIDTSIYLTLINDETGCVRKDSITIHVRHLVAEFSMDTVKICPGDTVTFDPSLSQQYEATNYAWNLSKFFRWNFGDNSEFGNDPVKPDTISNGSISHVYNTPGVYNVRLKVYDMYECSDSVVHQVKVFGTYPVAIITPPSGCTPIDCIFTDSSYADTAIVSWQWSFGQGDSSFFQNPSDTISYTIDSSYTVTLEIVDALGCYASTEMEVVASTPIADYVVSNTIICFGDTIFFENQSTTYGSSPQYTWSFGDGSTSNIYEPFHIYQGGGTFTSSLEVIDGTCSATFSLPVNIQVQNPVTDIVSSITGVVCAPEHVIFHADPHPSYFTQILWNLGDGTWSYAEEPGHNYTQTGIYPITLFVHTTANCTYQSDTLYLNVALVNAELTLSDYLICLGEDIDLSVQNQVNVEGFFIDFGDGSPFGLNSQINHTYNIASQFGYLIPTLQYWSEDSGCVESDYDTLWIEDVRAYFSRGPNDEDTAACYNLTVQFQNEAIGANAYFWDFGNGSYSYEVNPAYSFNSPGDYFVQLTASGQDCPVTEGKWVHVFPPPPITVNAYNEICYGDSIQLDASGGISYIWTPDSFLTGDNIPNPVANPPYSYYYNINVTDERDCVNDETVEVFVQQTPEFILSDTTIIVGDIFDLPDTALYNVEYFWSPTYGLLYPNSFNPVFQPLESTNYTVTMYAYANGVLCDTASANYFVDVLWQFSVDVPQVFTPNGDGVNDFVFVRGWGIRKLIEFSIYNRWGELVFRTDDIRHGWDGIYKGQLQTSDTYVYDVEIETYSNQRLKKKGSINLMR